jgi:hypothetical protein
MLKIKSYRFKGVAGNLGTVDKEFPSQWLRCSDYPTIFDLILTPWAMLLPDLIRKTLIESHVFL